MPISPKARRMVACLASCAAVSCAAPFEAPSEYSRQRFLCDSTGFVAAADVAACRDAFARDGTCAGLLSMRGRLEGQEVTLGVPIRSASMTGDPTAKGIMLDGIAALGTSPYFDYRFLLESVGGRADAAAVPLRNYSVSQADVPNDRKYDDDIARVELRLTSGGESQNLRATSGTLSLDGPNAEVITGKFSGRFGGSAEPLEGCFLILGAQRP